MPATYKRFLLFFLVLINGHSAQSVSLKDQLRGADNQDRNWWRVLHYKLSIQIHPEDSTLTGSNTISYQKIKNHKGIMQIDLQAPLKIDSVLYHRKKIAFEAKHSVWYIKHNFKTLNKQTDSLTLYYSGKPRIAKMPPWDGGFVWSKDANGNPWVSVASQGVGASAWWPNKDLQGEKPQKGVDLYFTVPSNFDLISNGKLIKTKLMGLNKTWHWRVVNPIANYLVTFYMGHYAHIRDSYNGLLGPLSLDFYPLVYQKQKAEKHFKAVKPMLKCFESWMGAYPFYKDGYKIVEAPYLGMENQSAIAYGNDYVNGYKGTDRSNTGVGLSFDFIMVHESGHEWFGNNVTSKDIADNWIHEAFTTYTETLFLECRFGKQTAQKYLKGQRHLIKNQRPIIAQYGLNQHPPSDIYEKGAQIVHMVRRLLNNDERFGLLLKGINQVFYHKSISSKELETYIIRQTGLKLGPFFDQYLRRANLPTLSYQIKGNSLYYRWKDAVNGFTMPVEVYINQEKRLLHPSESIKKLVYREAIKDFSVNDDFYILKLHLI